MFLKKKRRAFIEYRSENALLWRKVHLSNSPALEKQLQAAQSKAEAARRERELDCKFASTAKRRSKMRHKGQVQEETLTAGE